MRVGEEECIVHQETFFTESRLFQGRHVHLGVTGSVASYVSADLLRLWKKAGLFVSVTLSEGARRFVTPLLFQALGAMPVYTDMFAEEQDVFAHLEVGQKAEVFVLAPASASAIARLAHGFANDLLSAQALAFSGPLLVAPAMNPRMYGHPALQENLGLLKKHGAHILEPDQGGTACGDEGKGRLCATNLIFWEALKAISVQDMQGKNVLITLGPTREFWDGVRFWSNPSTGRMGMAFALVAWMRGANVSLVHGPIAPYVLPRSVSSCAVSSAEEMYCAVMDRWDSTDVGIFTAAVADFSPVPYGDGKSKFKKDGKESFSIQLTRNKDILQSCVLKKRDGQRIIGFAAETARDLEELERLATLKREKKGCDILAANCVNSSQTGFASHTNQVVVCDGKRSQTWPLMSKTDVAWRICSWLLDA